METLKHRNWNKSMRFKKADFRSIVVTEIYFNGELKREASDLVGREISVVS